MSDGERRLAAIMFTDIVGYTALTQSNESQAMEVLERHNKLLRPFFPKFHGREVKAIGDSFLVEFDSALDALRCATEIQSYLHDYNLSSKEDWKIKLRIGIHLGDVIHKENDVFGDAVNIASRIEPIAGPEGICLSRQVYDQVGNKSELSLVPLGEKLLKNVSVPVDVYAVQMPWESKSRTREVELEIRRIAVLPFVSLSPDPNDEYFADGLTEELIDRLCQISELEVIARTSAMNYKKERKNAGQIGKELRAGALVEGSVRKADNRIRITAQLINANTEGHLWSSRYDRKLEDIFEVQSDVAKQVAEALRVRILSPELERIDRKPTESTTAYALYLQGRYYWNRRGISDVKKAMGFFELAVQEDSKFALGYVGLADCLLILRSNWNIDLESSLDKAEAMVAKALTLDPDLAEAHATKGLALSVEFKFKEAEEEFKRAVELKPSYASAHQWYSQVFLNQMKMDEAFKELDKAIGLDPLSPIINQNLGYYYLVTRDYDRALAQFGRAAELGEPTSHSWMGVTYWKMKKFGEMKREFAIAEEIFRGSFPLLKTSIDLWVAYIEGDKETVKRILPHAETHMQENALDCFSVALYHFYLGEKDEGFEWLERSYSRKENSIAGIKMVSWMREVLEEVRKDPRYSDLLKRLGLE